MTSQSSQKRSQRIPTLDGWRAIAVLMVIVSHAGASFEGLSETAYFASSPTRFGVNGVAIFFALSGLLICKLLIEEFERAGRIDLIAFYARRAFRILPPLSILMAVLAGLGLFHSRQEAISCFGFFRNYMTGNQVGLYTAHVWTLSVEEHFYLFWPALLIWLLHGRRPLLFTVLTASGIGLWRSADLHLHLVHRMAPWLDTGWRTDYRLDAILWGCVAAFILHREHVRIKVVRYLSPTVAFATFAGCCMLQIISVPLGAIWTSIGIAVLLLSTVTHSDWAISRFLRMGPVEWLGRISYSLYLWQQLFFFPARDSQKLSILQVWPWNLAACFLCAIASYYLVEKPMIVLGKRFLSRLHLKTVGADPLTNSLPAHAS